MTGDDPKAPTKRKAVVVHLEDDPLGYDVTDIDAAIRLMAENALSGRNREAVEKELAAVRKRFEPQLPRGPRPRCSKP
jgi:hypothetical protein